MTEQNNTNRYSEIIKDYLSQNADGEGGDKMMDSFAKWFFNESDREEKERILQEINLFGQDDPSITEEKIKEIVEKFKATRLQPTNKNMVAPKRKLFARTWMKVAAVVVPLIVVAGIWMFTNNGVAPTMVADFSVPYGNTDIQKLADSSVVSINAGSRLSINQNKNERVAELTGESYFKVTKDEQRPFIVKTHDLTVTVLGTEFNVEAYPDSDFTTVTLDKGRVAIKTINNKQYTLEPEQQFVYTKSTGEGVVKSLDRSKAQEVSAWQDGVLVLDNVTLTDAFSAIERRYNVKIKIAQGAVFNNMVTFKCSSDESAEDIIRRISIIVPNLQYRIENGEIIISGK